MWSSVLAIVNTKMWDNETRRSGPTVLSSALDASSVKCFLDQTRMTSHHVAMFDLKPDNLLNNPVLAWFPTARVGTGLKNVKRGASEM